MEGRARGHKEQWDGFVSKGWTASASAVDWLIDFRTLTVVVRSKLKGEDWGVDCRLQIADYTLLYVMESVKCHVWADCDQPIQPALPMAGLSTRLTRLQPRAPTAAKAPNFRALKRVLGVSFSWTHV